MSYDLYFQKKNKQKLERDEFSRYFKSRPHYKGEPSGQALYDNDETGVYFTIEHNEAEGLEEVENPADYSPANFCLNYIRPHIFALEAAPEIASFVNAFDLSITDLQRDGNPGTTYNKEAFIRGWTLGNKFAFDSIIKTNPEVQKQLLPSKDIERYWLWNFHKNELQNQLGENIFVPQISFHILNGEVKSLIVWSEAIPTAFPEVDTIMVFRQSLAPSGFFSSKKNDFTIVEYSKILPLLGDTVKVGNIHYRKLLSADKAKEWVKALPASDTKPASVSVDRVLDRELVS